VVEIVTRHLCWAPRWAARGDLEIAEDRSAAVTSSRPAAVISTRRVLRKKSVTPSTRSSRFTVRVSAGCEVFR
jgi:hypothetical protein